MPPSLPRLALAVPASGAATSKTDTALRRALDAFVKRADGRNGISVVVERDAEPVQLGYPQFIASTRDGKRSTVVSINSQLTPERNPKPFAALHKVYELAVRAALEGS